MPRFQVLSFLTDIKAHPEDDTPALVFADWLEDQPDPATAARGEFLRLQCLRHRLPPGDPLCLQYQRREQELQALHEPAWLGRLRPLIWVAKYRRGLVSARGWARELLGERADPLAGTGELAWVDRLRLVGNDETFSRVAHSPVLAGITALDLSGNHLSAFAVIAILSSPSLGHLVELDLRGNILAPVGMREAMLSLNRLPRLKALDVGSNLLGPGGMPTLLFPAVLAQLTALGLQGNQLRDDEAQALAAASWRQLRKLNLAANSISDNGVEALASSPQLAHLEELDLSGNNFGSAGARALASSPHLKRLRLLRIGGYGFDSNVLSYLIKHFGSVLQVHRYGDTLRVLGPAQ